MSRALGTRLQNLNNPMVVTQRSQLSLVILNISHKMVFGVSPIHLHVCICLLVRITVM